MKLVFLCSSPALGMTLNRYLKAARVPKEIEASTFVTTSSGWTSTDGRTKLVLPTLVLGDVAVTVGEAARRARPNWTKQVTALHWAIPDSEPRGGAATAAAFPAFDASRRLSLLILMLGGESAELLTKTTPYRGRVLTLDVEEIRLPNDRVTTLEMLRHPGAAAVVPLTADGKVILIRQYRHAAGGFILEVPAGKLDGEETPEECAEREIVEEAGQRAGRLHRLGPMWTTPGFTDEIIHLFAATDLEAAAQNLEQDELIETLALPWERALELVSSAEIRDGKSALAILRTDQELKEGRLSFR